MSSGQDPGPPPGEEATDTLGLQAARGVGITLSVQILRAVLQFGSLVILARLLTPADFGVVAAVTAIIGVADVLRDFGLSSAAIQAKTLSDDERTNLFWANFGLGTVCAALVIVCVPLIDRVYRQDLTAVTICLSSLFVISGLNTQFNAQLARALRFHVLSICELVAQLIGLCFSLALAVSGAGYWAIVTGTVVSFFMVLCLNVFFCRWRPGLPKRHVSIRRFFRFGVGVLGTQFISYLTRNVDNVAVGIARGPVELGYYSRAYQLLITPINLINTPMTRVALPVLSRIHDDKPRYARYLERGQLVACYLTATVLAVAAGLAGPLVDLLLGPRWSPAGTMFTLLAIGGVFRAVEQVSYWMFLSSGRTGAQFKLYLYTRPLMIALIASGVIWGGNGVAAASSIGYLLYWIVSLIAAGRVVGIDVRPLFRMSVQIMGLVSIPAGLAAFGGALVFQAPLARVLTGALCALAYLAAAALLLPPVRRDSKLVLQFARQAVGR